MNRKQTADAIRKQAATLNQIADAVENGSIEPYQDDGDADHPPNWSPPQKPGRGQPGFKSKMPKTQDQADA